jgi:hypothetical protein
VDGLAVPEQARFVRRSFSGRRGSAARPGPARASSLHRVAWLAETRGGRYPVTSFVTTLPAILRDSHAVFSPATLDRVEFTGLHRWAVGLLVARRRPVRCDTWRAKRASTRYGDSLFPTGSGRTDARAEREELARRQLFVALTRARDSLWLGRVGGGGP